MELVIFRVGAVPYALPAEGVSKVLEPLPVTPLPYAPEAVEGLVNVSGSVLMKIDMAVLLGLAPRSVSPEGNLLVIHSGRETVVAQVDEVLNKISLEEEDLRRYEDSGEAMPDLADAGPEATAVPSLVAGEFTFDGQMVLLLGTDGFALADMEAVGVPSGGGGLVGLAEAAVAVNDEVASQDIEMLTVEDGGEAYAFYMKDVLEIVEITPLTDLPAVGKEVEGLMLMRGEALLVTSLATMLGRVRANPARFVLVISMNGTQLGLSVEQVIGIERYEREAVQAVSGGDSQLEGYLPGQAEREGRMTGLISLSGLFDERQMAAYRRYLSKHSQEQAVMAELRGQSIRRLLAFKLGQERCALALASVDRVEDYVDPVDLPEGDELFSGVVQIKGEVAPVLDLRKRLGYPPGESAAYVVVRVQGAPWALVVDKVDRVIEIEERDITPVRNAQSDFVAEIGRLDGELISLLSLEPLAKAA